MKTKMIIFANKKYGKVRAIYEDSNVYVAGIDIGSCFDNSVQNSRYLIRKYCNNAVDRFVLSQGGRMKTILLCGQDIRIFVEKVRYNKNRKAKYGDKVSDCNRELIEWMKMFYIIPDQNSDYYMQKNVRARNPFVQFSDRIRKTEEVVNYIVSNDILDNNLFSKLKGNHWEVSCDMDFSENYEGRVFYLFPELNVILYKTKKSLTDDINMENEISNLTSNSDINFIRISNKTNTDLVIAELAGFAIQKVIYN